LIPIANLPPDILEAIQSAIPPNVNVGAVSPPWKNFKVSRIPP
jgi:hypothetical protein